MADDARESSATLLLLIVFALVVGAGTAVSPCVLPVLPAMLSARSASCSG
jgi:cytochrome c biogenesis protein CcdA